MDGFVNKENDIIDKLISQKTLSDVLRILIPLYVTYIIFVLGMFLVFIPRHESHLLDQKKETIRQLTNSAVSLLADYEARVRQGEMTWEAARQKAVGRIRNLRYGLQGKDYFWINDMHPFMIMHPFRPDLEGEDLSRLRTAAGNYPFVEMVQTVKESGEGYVNYHWQWKDMPEKISPKMSYIKRFAPWDWMIGTGIYMDDITKEINAITRHLILIFAGMLLLVILMSFYISRQVVRIDQKKNLAEKARQLEELRLKKLYELSQMTEKPINTMTVFALEEAISLTRSEIGFLAFLNADESLLTMHTWSRQAMMECEITDKVLEYSVADTGLWASAAQTRQPVIINDYVQYDSPEKKGCPRGHVRISRMMTIPVFDKDKMVAVAGVGNKASDYNTSDVRQLQLMMDGMWKIIQKKKNEDDLRQSEEKYRFLTENATDVLWIMQMDNLEMSYVSPAIESLLGYGFEEFIQLNISTYLGETSVKKVKAVIAAELEKENDPEAAPDRMQSLELEMFKKDGTAVWVEIVARFLRNENSCPDRILGTSRDITQRKRLEDRIKQTQKMEALGTLAGGIAHDFNNILSSIIGFTELAKLDLSDNPEALDSLEQVMAAGLRARDLVQHILTFSRKADVQHQVIKIVPLIKECLKFIKASAPPDIDIRKKIIEKDMAVLADPTQIHQMIMNLLTNAVHAMKETGGTLEVTIKSVIIHTDEILQTQNIRPGPYAKILISDTGCGIPGVLTEKIFEPFFTTKHRGEGTGMGLSIVYGIVKDLKGDIAVYSEPGTGTTFQVLIPEKRAGADQETTLNRAALITGKGSILVVDDEPSIVVWTSKVLSKIGYSVAGVSGGQGALDTLAQDPDGFDLVITDLAMPKMDGLALSQQIKGICPDIPIILCTGFSEGLKTDLLERYNITAMIMKPMIASELSAIVNKALEKSKQKDHGQ